jgi:hypothetical protein
MNVLAPKTPHQRMASFDRLPEGVRRAVADADFAYDPDIVAARLRCRNEEKLAAEIRERTLRRMGKCHV